MIAQAAKCGRLSPGIAQVRTLACCSSHTSTCYQGEDATQCFPVFLVILLLKSRTIWGLTMSCKGCVVVVSLEEQSGSCACERGCRRHNETRLVNTKHLLIAVDVLEQTLDLFVEDANKLHDALWISKFLDFQSIADAVHSLLTEELHEFKKLQFGLV